MTDLDIRPPLPTPTLPAAPDEHDAVAAATCELQAVLAHLVLDVHLARAVAREREPGTRDRAVHDERLDLLAVEVLLRLVPRAEVVVRRPDGDALCGEVRAVLQEGAEGRGARAEAGEDEGLHVIWWEL